VREVVGEVVRALGLVGGGVEDYRGDGVYGDEYKRRLHSPSFGKSGRIAWRDGDATTL
jgi:hypothetical protein